MLRLTILYTVLAFTFSACSHTPHNYNFSGKPYERYFASEDENRLFETQFQKLIEVYERDVLKPNIEISKSNETMKMLFAPNFISVYFKLDMLVREFDRQLEGLQAKCAVLQNPGPECDMMNTETYKKIQVYRALKEKVLAKMSYFYIRLLDLTNIENNKRSMVLEASVQDQKILQSSQKGDSAQNEILALSKLARNLIRDWNSALNKKLKESQNTGEYPVFLEVEENRQELIVLYNFASRHSRDKSLPAASAYYEKNKALIDKQIEKFKNYTDPEFKEIYDSMYQGRSPQSHYPSTGAPGNVNGNSFPAGSWALTYDDGPLATNTSKILDVLDENKMPATFFWLAKNASAASNSAVIQKAKDLGMILASHSYTHADLSKATANLDYEIVRSKEVLESVYKTKVEYFRLPYGAGVNKANVRELIAKNNMIHFFWNVDSLDWQDKDPASIYNRVTKQMNIQKRGILLFHDIHAQTLAVTKMLADKVFHKNSSTKLEALDKLIAKSSSGTVIPTPVLPVSEGSYSFPHTRTVVSSTVNVRNANNFSSSDFVCGEFVKGEQIIVEALESGAFRLKKIKNNIIEKNKVCPEDVFMSAKTVYSIEKK